MGGLVTVDPEDRTMWELVGESPVIPVNKDLHRPPSPYTGPDTLIPERAHHTYYRIAPEGSTHVDDEIYVTPKEVQEYFNILPRVPKSRKPARPETIPDRQQSPQDPRTVFDELWQRPMITTEEGETRDHFSPGLYGFDPSSKEHEPESANSYAREQTQNSLGPGALEPTYTGQPTYTGPNRARTHMDRPDKTQLERPRTKTVVDKPRK